jgi:hypothetical protein
VILAIAACGGSNPGTGDDAPIDDGPTGDGPTGDGPSTADAPPDPCAPDTWCIEDSPTPGLLLRAVWAANLDDVFAVGDAGTILHRRNNAWTAMTTGTTKNLRGIWGLSASDIWAAGDDGTLLHYDGAQWTQQGSRTDDFHGVWASGPDDVWITAAGTVVHWDGQALAATSLPGELFAISGTGPTNVWVTGEQAFVHHYTGSWETGLDPGAGATYFAVLALAGETWVSTFTPSEQTVRFANNTWTPHAAPSTTFQAFHAVTSTDIWAAGGTRVGHWNGATWSVEQPAGGSVQMFGIGGIANSFWIVGSDSLILHRR